MNQSFFNALYCAQCGAQLHARTAALDGSAICLICRTIEDLPEEKRPILKLLRKLGEKWQDVPADGSEYPSEDYISLFVRPLEKHVAKAFAETFSLSEKQADLQARDNQRTFEQWNEIIKTGIFPFKGELTPDMRAHIQWLCDDMLELNEASFKAAKQGDLDWDLDAYASESRESNILCEILTKLEKTIPNDVIELTKDEVAALEECNDMDLNDNDNVREHYEAAVAFEHWLEV